MNSACNNSNDTDL